MTEPQHDRSDVLTGGELLAAISTTVVRVVADYTGRGPTRARTFINGDWIFVAVQDTLTKGERKLVALGRDDFVLDTRKTFQNAMREELSREIETLTGRAVIAFLSDNHVDPDIGLEAMLLAPDRSSPHGDGPIPAEQGFSRRAQRSRTSDRRPSGRG